MFVCAFTVISRVYREYRPFIRFKLLCVYERAFFLAQLFTRSHNKRDGRPVCSVEPRKPITRWPWRPIFTTEHWARSQCSLHPTVSFCAGRRWTIAVNYSPSNARCCVALHMRGNVTARITEYCAFYLRHRCLQRVIMIRLKRGSKYAMFRKGSLVPNLWNNCQILTDFRNLSLIGREVNLQ